MKYRIIQDGLGRYIVQKKRGFWQTWEKVLSGWKDYPFQIPQEKEGDGAWGYFKIYANAKDKMQKEKQHDINKILEEEHVVIEEDEL